MGWDDLTAFDWCFPASHPSQSLLHVACTPWLQALAFPQHGESPEHPLSVQGRAGGTEARDPKRRGIGQVQPLLGAPKALQKRRTFLRRTGGEPSQGDTSCDAGACRVLGMLVPAAGRGSGHQQERPEFDQESNRTGDQIWRGRSWECMSASWPSLNSGTPALPSFIHRSGSVPGT